MGPYPKLIQGLDTFFSSEKLPFLEILPSCFDTPRRLPFSCSPSVCFQYWIALHKEKGKLSTKSFDRSYGVIPGKERDQDIRLALSIT